MLAFSMQDKLLRQKPKFQQECRQLRPRVGRMWNVRPLVLYFYCSGYRRGLMGWKTILTLENFFFFSALCIDTHSPGLEICKKRHGTSRVSIHFPWLPFLGCRQRQKMPSQRQPVHAKSRDLFLDSTGYGAELQSQALRWKAWSSPNNWYNHAR